MPQAIRVDTQFATVKDTARTLGVSKARLKELVEKATPAIDRILFRDSKMGEFVVTGRARRKSAAASKRKHRDAGKTITTKTKTSRSKR